MAAVTTMSARFRRFLPDRNEECDSSLGLLVAFAVVFQPAVGMAALRIAMRPVDDAALVVPFVFAVEGNAVTFAKRLDARRGDFGCRTAGASVARSAGTKRREE